MYKSSVVIERIDYLLMEQGAGESVFPQSDFRMMIAEDLHRNIEQVWRVRFYEDGTVAMYSFAMPTNEKNLPSKDRLNAQDIPTWAKERISVLQICESGATIDGVGQKVSENVYYVLE